MCASSKNDDEKLQVFTKKLQRALEDWREIVLLLHDVLIWRNIPSHPALIFGLSSIVFLFTYWLNPTVLSTIAFIVFCIVLVDYFGPIVNLKIYPQELWNGSKEKQYHKVCYSIASYYILVTSRLVAYRDMKYNNPALYYSTVLTALFALAWIGRLISAVLLIYVIVTFLLLLPGLKKSGILDKALQQTKQYLASSIRVLTADKR